MLTIDSFLDGIDYLPPVPRNLSRLMELVTQTDIAVDEIAELIQFDPALTAQVMRLCNSASFGGVTPAANLHEATLRLGLSQIFLLVTALSTAVLIRPPQQGYGIEAGELWKHSVAAGLAGRILALERDENAAVVFTACILHDLGKVVLSRCLEDKYQCILEETRRSQTPMVAVEKALLGVDHAEVGAGLLERWHFPPSLVLAVRHHHDPAAAPQYSRLAAYTYLGNMMSCFMGFGCGHEALAMRGREEALELADIQSEDIPRCMTKAFYAFRDTQALFDFAF